MPSKWTNIELGKMVELAYGSGLPDTKRSGAGFPVYGSNGVVGYHKKALVKGPGIIVGRKGTVGAVIWSETDFWPIDTTYYVIPKDDSNLKWISYQLKSLGLSRLDSSTGVPGLNRNDAYQLLVRRPPKNEQSIIAMLLSDVDNVIDQTKVIIAKLKRIKQGLMQDLLTKGVDEHGNIRNEKTHRFKDSQIGLIPKEWDIKSIMEIGEVKGGKRLPKGHSFADGPTEYPYIRVVDFSNYSVLQSDLEYLRPETRRLIKRYTISSKDVYISIAGTIGIVGTVPDALDGASLTENAAKITNPDFVSNRLLAYLLDTQISHAQIAALTGTTTQPKLALERIKTIRVPIAPPNEQEAILARLDRVSTTLASELNFLQKCQAIKRGLMQDLLSGKVRVASLMEQV